MADAAGRGRAVTPARLLAAVALLAGVAAGQTLDVDLAAYRQAEAAGVVGAVAGRAYAERRTPTGAEEPLTGTVVVLVPHSAALVGRLEEIKTHARDSERAFLSAATAIRRAREAYEKRLWEAGVADFVRATVVDERGAFSVAGVPAGRWLLLATRSVFLNKPSPKSSARDRDTFTPRLRLVGSYEVSVWLLEVAVARGGSATAALMDRNVWFTGIVEDRVLDTGR